MNAKNGQLMNASNQKLMGLKHLLEQRKESIAKALPKHLTTERVIKMAIVAASRSPLLLQCVPESIFNAMIDSSQLGLEPFSPLNLSYIIPYRNGNTGQYEAKFMPSYRGLLELSRRSGEIKSIQAEVVYERDTIEVEKGLTPKLRHVPVYDGKDAGKPVLIYAIANFKDGGYQFVIMTVPQIEEIRKKSKSANKGPWVDFWEEMAKKSALKNLLKYCPSSTQLLTAMEKDNAIETGEEIIDVDSIDMPTAVNEEAFTTESRADSLVEKLIGNQETV